MNPLLDLSQPELLDYDYPNQQDSKIHQQCLKKISALQEENIKVKNSLAIAKSQCTNSQQIIKQLSKRIVTLSKQNFQFLAQNDNLKEEDIPSKEKKFIQLNKQKQQIWENVQKIKQQLKIKDETIANLNCKIDNKAIKYALKKQQCSKKEKKIIQLAQENARGKIRIFELQAALIAQNQNNIS